VEYPREAGTSHWRSFNSGDLRMRIVDYGSGYLANHWCDRGHVLHVISGEMTVDLGMAANCRCCQATAFACLIMVMLPTVSAPQKAAASLL
jgi:hypothetical protein